MARMYPNQLDQETESHAERLLYKAFRDELDNSYTVFHSVHWQSLDGEGRPRDGEADFVIAHPDRGILIMEAKGGSIRNDPRSGEWISIDRGGRSHHIKDPFGQARRSRYSLEDRLRIMLRQPKGRLNLGQVVAFPETVVREDLPGLDRPRQIVLDTTDLARLSGWVGGALSYYRGGKPQRETAPGDRAVEALMDLLGKAWELRPVLWGDVVREREQLIRLTEQQYMILDVLNQQRRAAICGCAGSGKTMLAAEKASRLARQGFRTLLTCFNTPLAADLRARLKRSPKPDIVHFHGLCRDLAKQAGVLPVKKDRGTYYRQQLPEALLAALDRLDVRYDAIIVDEGQDFRDDWWIPLQMLLSDPNEGILYVFYDDNQRIYARGGAFPIEQQPYPLSVNCRNTQAIHQTVLSFYEAQAHPTARGPVGRPVEVVRFGHPDKVCSTLKALLDRLMVKDGVPADEIAVLSSMGKEKSRIWQGAAACGLSLSNRWPASPGQVFCTTIHSFKGLERAVIILAEIDRPWLPQWTDLDSLLYVGCSRACNHLVVLLSEDASQEMLKTFGAA